MRDHIYQIASRSETATVSKHFLHCNEGHLSFLRIQGIESIIRMTRGGDRLRKLLQNEVKWIFHLNTREPDGLNVKWDVNCFI
ncbi:hypothetical protein XELAEV_18016036mg [Xenopus laevis]|uniref:Uncharacterized protein n=1 Tax=Xenopus laevis TaxID=8355 RepID=A0A974DKS0_XENLA|nr:hypothetical protein XELAEV_18016036mg [Xenopus laevis]